MAVSDAEYNEWIKSPSPTRCVLVEVGVRSAGVEVVRYLSNKGFVTSATSTPANTEYKGIIKGGVRLTESLSLESNATLSYGDIEIDNTTGEFDSWLLDVWDNRSVSVFYGSTQWDREDFRLVFKGTLASIGSSSRTSLNLVLRDNLQRLNSPVSDVVLGGTTSNKGRLLPITIGECHNVSPLLLDPTLHEYQVNTGQIEDIIEVRDNGAPVAVTKYLSDGKFRLTASPAGTITASVQGVKSGTYSDKIVDSVKTLVKNYGAVGNRLTDSDLDLTNLNAFAATNNKSIGTYLSDKVNLLETVQQIAGSVGGQITTSRSGKLRILRIDFPATSPVVTITPSDIIEKSLSIDSVLPVVSSVRLDYCKNFTVQNNLQTVVPEEHKSLYEQEWLTVSVADGAVSTVYRQVDDSTKKNSLLLTTADATAEANRRLNITKQQRVVYKMTCLSSMFNLELGQTVTLINSRFGLSGGVNGVVVGLEPDWITAKVAVKVMI
jgi:hypothetical protein